MFWKKSYDKVVFLEKSNRYFVTPYALPRLIWRYYNMPLMWDLTWLRSSSISLEGYGSKIRKVSRCRAGVSNEPILATRQEFFLTKSNSRTKHNWQSILGVLINAALLSFYFILHYYLFFDTIDQWLFQLIIFTLLLISEYNIWSNDLICWGFFRLRKGHSI